MYLFLWNVLKCSREENQKYLKNKKNPWPKNWITSCSYGHCMFLPLSFCWAGTLNILQFNRRPLEITFRFPSLPSVDLFKRLPQWTGRGTASPLKPSPHPLPPFLHRTATFFICNAKPVFVVVFFCYLNGWVSTRCTQLLPPTKKTTQDRNIKCPQSVCKRMPSITLYAGLKWWTTTSQHVTGARTLWKMIWEMHNIFSLPSAWLSQTFKLQAMCPIAMLIQCILNKCNFKVFFKFMILARVHCISFCDDTKRGKKIFSFNGFLY